MKKRVVRNLFIVLLILIIILIATEVLKYKREQEPPLVIEEETQTEVIEEVEEEPEEPEEPKRTIDDVADKNDPDSYTYEEIDEVFYFAAENAKVRKLPWDESESIGTLYLDQAVKVYAQCIETGYYKIKTSGKFYYVSEDELSAEYFPIELPLPKEIKKPTKQKDILFIGNSITKHGPAEFWWGDDYGMGATSRSNDYVHLTVSAMGYDSYDVMSMRDWEMKDCRNKYLTYMDSYVSKYDYDIVVIFLGENAKGKEGHFGGDLVSMIEYIRAFNPDVKVVMMDNFWKFDDIIADKKAAAEEAGATYVSLEELWDVSSYQLYAGQTVEANGGTYTVDDFVAGHPNNKGMKAISEKLVEALEDL